MLGWMVQLQLLLVLLVSLSSSYYGCWQFTQQHVVAGGNKHALNIKSDDDAANCATVHASQRNNFVSAFLEQVAVPHAGACYRFELLRDSWVFLRANITAGSQIALDPLKEQSRAIVARGDSSVVEVMRKLTKGLHILDAQPNGGHIAGLVLRRIPEIIYTEVGYTPSSWLKSFGPYNWRHMQRIGMADNVNVVLERTRNDDSFNATDWREVHGKKVLTYGNILTMQAAIGADFTAEQAAAYLAGRDGFASSDRDGVVCPGRQRGRLSAISVFLCKSFLYGAFVWARRALKHQKRRFPARAVDELGYGLSDAFYLALAGAVKLLAAEPALKGKVLQPYTTALFYNTPQSE
jgi:hypothetical protein